MNHLFLFAASMLCFGFGQPVQIQSDDAVGWLQFRGPGGTGCYQYEEALPDALDLETHLKWKTPTIDGHSSPIIVGNSIILTGYETGKLSTMCFDLASGDLRWRRDIDVEKFERTNRLHGPATPTPVSDGQRIFVAFGSLGVVAYDLQGDELWRDEREIHRNMFGSASSPILVDGKLIVFASNRDESLLQALDPDNGSVIWERRRPGPASSWSTPTVRKSNTESTLLVYEPFNLRCISLVDGSDIWSIPELADEPITIPLLHDELIITTSYNLRLNKEAIGLPTFEALLSECDANGDGQIDLEESKTNQSVLSRPDADTQGDHPLSMFFRRMDANRDQHIQAEEYPYLRNWVDSFVHANGFIAVRSTDATSVPELVWKHETGVPECPSPIVLDGKLFAVRNGGVVTCLEIETGKLLSRARVAPGGPYYAALVAGDNKIFLASNRGELTILSAEKQPQLLATVDLSESIRATPALAPGQLVVRSKNHLWLFQNPSDSK